MMPSEFWNSTYRTLYKFVKANNIRKEEDYKKQIILFDALGNKLSSELRMVKPKKVSLVTDTFSHLFEEEINQIKNEPQSIEEQIRNLRSRK